MDERTKTMIDAIEKKFAEKKAAFEKMTPEQKAEVLKERERKAKIMANHSFTIKPVEDQPGVWQVILTLDGKTQNCAFKIDPENVPPFDEVIKIIEMQVNKLISYYVMKHLL